jgi:TRAP-type C4-dicarboxylate transport system permease small subunit
MQVLRACIYHISAALFCGILALLGVSVFCRYVLNDSIVWSEEVIRFAFIWMFFLSMGEVSRTGSHLALDLVPDLLKGKAKKTLGVVIEIANIIFFCILIYYSWKVAQANMAQKSPALLIPYGVIYMAIPTGGALMTFFSLQRIVGLISGKNGVASATETEEAR